MFVILLSDAPRRCFYGGITNDFRIISCDFLSDCVFFNDYDSACFVLIELGKLGICCRISEVDQNDL